MKGENLNVLGIKGSFDDAQNALKDMLGSDEFKAGLSKKNTKLTAANSVNFGRIIFQIIYHVHSYLELLRQEAITMGEKIYLVIPSGNFGNALGAYYAQKMGIPIEKMLIASNENNVLTDLITTGKYDLRTKALVNTTSPAMDILKSSNIERILYDLFGAIRTKELMNDLNTNNFYELNNKELAQLRTYFSATYSNDEECAKGITKYANKNYIMETHTATCLKSYEKKRDKPLKTVIYSTAEWTKFSPVVNDAVNPSGADLLHDKEALDAVSNKFGIKVPDMIHELFETKERFTTIIEKENIEQTIIDFL
jgi:threonine synthase